MSLRDRIESGDPLALAGLIGVPLLIGAVVVAVLVWPEGDSGTQAAQVATVKPIAAAPPATQPTPAVEPVAGTPKAERSPPRAEVQPIAQPIPALSVGFDREQVQRLFPTRDGWDWTRREEPAGNFIKEQAVHRSLPWLKIYVDGDARNLGRFMLSAQIDPALDSKTVLAEKLTEAVTHVARINRLEREQVATWVTRAFEQAREPGGVDLDRNHIRTNLQVFKLGQKRVREWQRQKRSAAAGVGNAATLKEAA